jgi:hypothetical protein
MRCTYLAATALERQKTMLRAVEHFVPGLQLHISHATIGILSLPLSHKMSWNDDCRCLAADGPPLTFCPPRLSSAALACSHPQQKNETDIFSLASACEKHVSPTVLSCACVNGRRREFKCTLGWHLSRRSHFRRCRHMELHIGVWTDHD